MVQNININSALISVFYKDGLDSIIRKLNELGVKIYSTGGTQDFIENLNVKVERVEDLTGYPSILDGRVKTLHPNVFGGILAKRNEKHLDELKNYEIPTIDLVIVDLYPFEETVLNGGSEDEIIEKIDIGGISLIRAAAKNYNDVLVVSSRNQYSGFLDILNSQEGKTSLEQRKKFAADAFQVSSHYDTAIFDYLADSTQKEVVFKESIVQNNTLRYGENPHQKGIYFGDFESIFTKISGKELSYNNLVDIDAALSVMKEFDGDLPTFAILKHTNTCGIATRKTPLDAWSCALQADPVSAFGGVLICNAEIDEATATEIDKIFYEVLIAPSYTKTALEILRAKTNRVLLILKEFPKLGKSFKSLLNGVIVQDSDLETESSLQLEVKTIKKPEESEISDLLFAMKCAKHLKSNTITLVRNKQLLSMGCGQTSRVDACKQAIEKAKSFGLDLKGAVMASDAFFPFPDCVELVKNEGILTVIQPGGSIKDQLSIDYCNKNGMSMVFTGVRHFKH